MSNDKSEATYGRGNNGNNPYRPADPYLSKHDDAVQAAELEELRAKLRRPTSERLEETNPRLTSEERWFGGSEPWHHSYDDRPQQHGRAFRWGVNLVSGIVIFAGVAVVTGATALLLLWIGHGIQNLWGLG